MKSCVQRWIVAAMAGPLAVACAAGDGGAGAELTEPNGGACVPEHVVPVRLTTGEETQVATMTIRTSESGVRIWIEAEPGWLLGDTYATFGHDGSFVQVTENETPWIDGYVSSIHFDLSLEQLRLSCGDVFKLIVQLRVRNAYAEPGAVEWASAYGSVRLDPSTDGWKEHYEICCEGAPERGCTLTQGYWRNHAWPVDPLEIGGTSFARATFLDYIRGGTHGNACKILGQQLMAARLNVESGASSIGAIGGAEDAFIAYCTPLGTFVHASTPIGQLLVGYSKILTDYNEGEIGPGHCDDRREPSPVPR